MKNLAGIPYDKALDILKDVMVKGNIDLHLENFIKGSYSKYKMDRKVAVGIWEMITSCPMSTKSYYVQKAVLTYKMAYLNAYHGALTSKAEL